MRNRLLEEARAAVEVKIAEEQAQEAREQKRRARTLAREERRAEREAQRDREVDGAGRSGGDDGRRRCGVAGG